MWTDEPRTGGAPPPLDGVAAFVNTRAITRAAPSAREDLDTPDALDAWARRHLGVAQVRGDTDELAAAHTVREGLRALLARHNDAGVPDDEQAVAALTALTDAVSLRGSPVGPLGDALVPGPGDPAGGVVGALLARVVTARLAGTWERLKVCRDPYCREAFYDASKNRSRSWCSMAVCGARAKQRAMTARRRGDRG